MTSVHRDNWRERVEASGLSLRELAARTGVSRPTVYAYSRGARRPTDAWISRCADVLRDYAWEWTCKVCLTRNNAERRSCVSCARSNDGYDPSIIVRPWGSAQ